MYLKLRDRQLKTSMCICVCVCVCVYIYIYIYIYIYTHTYIYILLYKNLMVTTNQKSITDIHKKKKKESKHKTKDSHQITRGENKRRGKRPTKTNPKQLTKCQ